MSELTDRLREACNGHPHAKIEWPHRLLHDAIAALDAKDARLKELEEALAVFARASDNFDAFWSEETGGQAQLEGDEEEMTTFFTLGVDLHMAPLAAYRRAKALSPTHNPDYRMEGRE